MRSAELFLRKRFHQYQLIGFKRRGARLTVSTGYVYVGVTMSDKSGDKNELPWFSNDNSLLSPLLSLIAAPT
jgi:hypothetical protein